MSLILMVEAFPVIVWAKGLAPEPAREWYPIINKASNDASISSIIELG